MSNQTLYHVTIPHVAVCDVCATSPVDAARRVQRTLVRAAPIVAVPGAVAHPPVKEVVDDLIQTTIRALNQDARKSVMPLMHTSAYGRERA